MVSHIWKVTTLLFPFLLEHFSTPHIPTCASTCLIAFPNSFFLVFNPSPGLPPEFITVSHLELPNVFPCVNILSKHSHLCSLSILSFWTQFTFNSIASLWDSFQPCLLLQVQRLIIVSCIFFWVKKKKLDEFDNKIKKKKKELTWDGRLVRLEQ